MEPVKQSSKIRKSMVAARPRWSMYARKVITSFWWHTCMKGLGEGEIYSQTSAISAHYRMQMPRLNEQITILLSGHVISWWVGSFIWKDQVMAYTVISWCTLLWQLVWLKHTFNNNVKLCSVFPVGIQTKPCSVKDSNSFLPNKKCNANFPSPAPESFLLQVNSHTKVIFIMSIV